MTQKADLMHDSPGHPNGQRVVLASASPRRLELLKKLIKDFDVIPSNLDENRLEGEKPLDFACRQAREKARAVLNRIACRENQHCWVLGFPSDRLVWFSGLAGFRSRFLEFYDGTVLDLAADHLNDGAAVRGCADRCGYIPDHRWYSDLRLPCRLPARLDPGRG